MYIHTRTHTHTHNSYLLSPSPSLSTPQSHLPSFHPVLHLSSHLLQSNPFFPSFRLTSLCASHIQFPNSSLLSALTLFFTMNAWKSSAQTQHGYSLPKRCMKDLTSACSLADGFAGYCAVMECSSVQDARPSCSTSGGQSGGGPVGRERVLEDFPKDEKSAKVVQARHLFHFGQHIFDPPTSVAEVENIRFAILAHHHSLGQFLRYLARACASCSSSWRRRLVPCVVCHCAVFVERMEVERGLVIQMRSSRNHAQGTAEERARFRFHRHHHPCISSPALRQPLQITTMPP